MKRCIRAADIRRLSGFSRPKIAVVVLVIAALGVSFRVGEILAGPQTESRRKLILRLYDLNCRAGIPEYRYPRSVMWLADGDPFGRGDWDAVFRCGSH
jgi:hypothetical protein